MHKFCANFVQIQNMATPKITLYLDSRREKSDGKYPVKLRVYYQARTKFYATIFDLTDKEFEGASSLKPRKDLCRNSRRITTCVSAGKRSGRATSAFHL